MLRYGKLIFAWGAGLSCGATSNNETYLQVVHISVQFAQDAAGSLQVGVDESYNLTLPDTQVAPMEGRLTAVSVWGALRGLETLSQLIDWHNGRYEMRWTPWVIRDRPVMAHRGVLIDTSRHYLPVETILRQIDALSSLRMNVLHWHAVDADSFPLEVGAGGGWWR